MTSASSRCSQKRARSAVSLFGATYAPLRIINTALVLVNAGLVYVLLRRRVGPVAALAPAVLLLFLGSSFGIVLMAFSINSLLAIAFGLGALLALDRADRRGDLIAGGLLVLSVLSFEWGLFFAAGMAVELWLREERPAPSRFLLPALPYAVWLIWWLWAPPQPGGDIAASNVAHVLVTVSDEAASLLASITGLFRTASTFTTTIDPTWGRPLAIAGLIALLWRLKTGTRPSGRFWALLTALLLFWLAVALTVSSFRDATTDRWVYGGAIVLFMIVAELLRGVRIPRGAYFGVALVLGFSLMANVNQLRQSGASVRAKSDSTRARLGAVQLAGERVAPDSYIDEPEPGSPRTAGLTFTAGQYLAEVKDHGSFGFSEEEISAGGEDARKSADEQLGDSLEIGAEAVVKAPAPPAGAPPVEPSNARDARLARAGTCVRMQPNLGLSGTAVAVLPAGGFSFSAPRDARVSVGLSRFSSEAASLDLAPTLGSGVVRIPEDDAVTPWRARVTSTHPVTICPL